MLPFTPYFASIFRADRPVSYSVGETKSATELHSMEGKRPVTRPGKIERSTEVHLMEGEPPMTQATSILGEDANFDHSERDIAAAVVPEYAQTIDQVVEQRTVRKIDMHLIPLMWIGFGLVYYDKV